MDEPKCNKFTVSGKSSLKLSQATFLREKPRRPRVKSAGPGVQLLDHLMQSLRGPKKISLRISS